MRTNLWLKNRLQQLWGRHFPDVKLVNNVVVRFGRPTQTRLGSIKLAQRKENHTIITINGFFRDPAIPDFVVDATLAHELSHYAHGFFSPHKRTYHYPHQGGVVRKEMVDRGLGDMVRLARRWLKANWKNYLRMHGHYF